MCWTSDLWQQRELPSEFESDLRDTVGWSRIVDFNAGKNQLVSFDWSNNTGAIDVKMDGSVLEEKLYFKMLSLSFFFFCKLVWSSYTISIAKTTSKESEALIHGVSCT